MTGLFVNLLESKYKYFSLVDFNFFQQMLQTFSIRIPVLLK